MTEYAAAVREMLERDLACRCGAANDPKTKTIKVDVNGIALCDNCGRGGDVAQFQPPKEK